MSFFNRSYSDGYTRGGLDVESALSNFFKFVLLSPILLGALQLSAIMLKHFIFNGVPSLNTPTEAQQEQLRERDSGIQNESITQQPRVPYEIPNPEVRSVESPGFPGGVQYIVDHHTPERECKKWANDNPFMVINEKNTGNCWQYLK